MNPSNKLTCANVNLMLQHNYEYDFNEITFIEKSLAAG